MSINEKTKAYVRSKSSAKKFKGCVEDYLPLHEWFDKPSHPALRHHAQGIFEAEKTFGVVITNSEGKHIPTRVLAEQHIKEEIGFIPTAQEWIECMELHKWMGYRNKDIAKYAKKEKGMKPISGSY